MVQIISYQLLADSIDIICKDFDLDSVGHVILTASADKIVSATGISGANVRQVRLYVEQCLRNRKEIEPITLHWY